jgi:hypothetical protein
MRIYRQLSQRKKEYFLVIAHPRPKHHDLMVLLSRRRLSLLNYRFHHNLDVQMPRAAWDIH